MRDAAYQGPSSAEWAKVNAWLSSRWTRLYHFDRELARLARLTPERLDLLAWLARQRWGRRPGPRGAEEAPLSAEPGALAHDLEEARRVLAELCALVSVEVPTPEPLPQEEPMPSENVVTLPPPGPTPKNRKGKIPISRTEALTPEEIEALRARGSQTAISEASGVPQSTLSAALRGRTLNTRNIAQLRTYLATAPKDAKPSGTPAEVSERAENPAARPPKIRSETGLSRRKEAKAEAHDAAQLAPFQRAQKDAHNRAHGGPLPREEIQAPKAEPAAPIPMLLWCPLCHARHIDQGPFATKPHHTHACQACGMAWRPAIVATVGVQFLPGFKDEEGGV